MYTNEGHNLTRAVLDGTHALTVSVGNAVLKARSLGIDLVSKYRAFRRFLELVPMEPGTVAIFLHHLYNWLDAYDRGDT
ncbi:hypothetical protein CMUS01_15586 [Colletotrichum musicola]|uniref:Uncharacterized protein n=1 Tax=Colletotrichum musicola TaxID=2175873 RepID=A0A8H6IV39_9PEZI|nr:hypothetical protein CMUS01_15586 [Colletotrichum musicola]